MPHHRNWSHFRRVVFAAEVVHSPDRCDTLRFWLHNMALAQVSLGHNNRLHCSPTQCHRWCRFWGSVKFELLHVELNVHFGTRTIPSCLTSSLAGLSETSHPDSWCNALFAQQQKKKTLLGSSGYPLLHFDFICGCYTTAILHCVQCIGREWSDEESVLMRDLFTDTICGCTIQCNEWFKPSCESYLGPLVSFVPRTEWTKWIFDCWARDGAAKDMYWVELSRGRHGSKHKVLQGTGK